MPQNENDPLHADVCGNMERWNLLYTSKDPSGHVIALELSCDVHRVQWWFPPLHVIKEGIKNGTI